MSAKPYSRRRFLIKSALGVAAVAALGGGRVLYKDQAWVESEPYRRAGSEPATTAVVVYSRSGNTLLAAKELARLRDAELFKIEAPGYPQSIAGQMQASDDASGRRRSAEINHAPIDFARYQHVVLSSPTWWYRPAVPMWAFVNRHDFARTEVSLWLTGNSGYRSDNIDEFSDLVNARGGRFSEFRFVRRGRVFWQLSADELRGEVRRLADV